MDRKHFKGRNPDAPKSSGDATDSVMDDQSASYNPEKPSFFWPPNLGRSNLKRMSRTEDSGPCPILGLAEDIVHMRVKEGSKIHNLLQFATARMKAGDGNKTSVRQMVFSGSGGGVTKTITCVEILKRQVEGLHQLSKLYYKTVTEIWESPQQGVPGVSVKKTVPAICILLSKDPLDAQEPGYQPPQTLSGPAADGERRLRAVLRPAYSPPAQSSAKRAFLDSWSACSPHRGEILENE